MEGVIEQQRRAHEEIERLQDVIARICLKRPKTHRERLAQDHKINKLFQRIQNRAIFLKHTYEDMDRMRELEMDALQSPDGFSEFYRRLKQIKEHHRRYPNEVVVAIESEMATLLGNPVDDEEGTQIPNDGLDTLFSGEEAFGRFLDLHAIHETFLNLKQFSHRKHDYLHYVDEFDKFIDVPCEQKNERYQRYIESLLTYLRGFVGRTKPLLNQTEFEGHVLNEFEQGWNEEKISRWMGKNTASAQKSETGLFCAVCNHEFAKNTVFQAHLVGKKHQKRMERFGLSTEGKDTNRIESLSVEMKVQNSTMDTEAPQRVLHPSMHKQLALLEMLVSSYGQLLKQQRENTKVNVERKQTRTNNEREEDNHLLEIGGGDDLLYDGRERLQQWLRGIGGHGVSAVPKMASDESQDSPNAHQQFLNAVMGDQFLLTTDLQQEEEDHEEDHSIYNPLKVPLGWDGKPIPYWLYKLHGLGIEYSCEICGGHVCMGRRAFERHFEEWRHTYGLKCLGIPYSRHFQEITSINDALTLWEKIKTIDKASGFKPEIEEEFEDREGNVFNRKTYEDLQRQGLL